MRGELSEQLTDVVNELLDDEEDINNYECKFSTGIGQWVNTPWAGIRRKDAANTFEEGIYVDYAFYDDFKTLRFSILQGINNASHNQRMDIFKELIPLIEIPEGFKIEEENPEIHFFRKNYDLDNLNEEEMLNDLKQVLNIYQDLIPQYKNLIKDSKNIIIDGRNIWKIATGESDITEEAWKEFHEDGFVAIGNWFEDSSQDIDYNIFNSQEEILSKLKETIPGISEQTKAPKMIWDFTNEIKIGDIVVASRGISKCLGIGIVTSDYIPPNEVNPNYKMRNIRKVDWIITEEIELIGKKFGQDTIYRLSTSIWNELIAVYCSNNPEIRFKLFESLFNDFYNNYFEKEKIMEDYERLSKEYSDSYNDILQKRDNNQDYSNDVWLNLISHDNCSYVPYNDSKSHFEQIGFGDNDLDEIAISVFDLIDDLVKSPNDDLIQQKLAIAKFNEHTYEGFQDGVLSPIFFLIEPYYYIINPRMVESFNFLRNFIKNTDSINKDLTDYIDNNLKLHELVKSFGEIIPQLGNFVVFNAFSIWLNNKKLGGGYATGKALPLELLDEYHPISTNEWTSVLENDILDSKMIEILKIIYESDNHAATTGEIRSIRASLGFKDEKSYNSLIVANSKKVKEFLNDKTILNEDGSEEYWSRFFDGEKVNGAFRFQIKEELVEALKIYIGGESMDFDSFYDYLIHNGYYFDKETVENYLLSLKVKPFVILTGNSGTGKTKLSQLFARYISQNSSYIRTSNSIKTEVTVGKSAQNGGWSLNRNDLKDLIPIEDIEDNFSIVVDGISAQGDLKITPRLFYKSDELKEHLAELAENNDRQKVSLEIFVDEDKFSHDEEYVSFRTDNFILNDGWFGIRKKTISSLLGLEKYEGTADIYFDDIKSSENLYLSIRTGSRDEKLINHLNSLDDLSNIEIKINKKDLNDTFLDDDSKGKNNILTFQRSIGQNYDWVVPKKDLYHFLPVKNKYSWNVVVDGIETTLDFWIHDLYIMASATENMELENYLNQKNSDDIINIKIDLSTFKPNDDTDNEIDYNKHSPLNKSNYQIIPVGANWTENRNIVGYYNVITDKYQSTPAYDLIKIADTDLDNPYFLILDEMNLSHVERYFADFLSAIESGESIPLYGNEEDLEIPDNLFIIGTVNVDETTYMFSPKVLDRANTIEFDTYSAKNYMLGEFNSKAPSGDIEYLENPLSGYEIRDMDSTN